MKSELLDLIKNLQTRYDRIVDSLGLEAKKEALKALQQKIEAPTFWDNPQKAQEISQKASHKQQFIARWETFAKSIQEFPELIEMATDEDLKDLETDLKKLEKQFGEMETETLLSGEYDTNSVILSIHTGNGGQDAEDFSQILLRMYLRFAEKKGYRTEILEESPSDDGIKSATIAINGPMAYGYLKSEHGIHRLIRLSPFNAKNLRQTSFSRVEILPKIESDDQVHIEESDIRIDVFRSSGAGGQSVNTTDSAVRITYLPLDLIVTCQNEKSQHQNKASAMNVLRSRLAQLKVEQQASELKELRGDLLENSFGSQIRTYTLQPYKLVKDHRTNYEENQPDKVFDGELLGFIEAFLRLGK